jgi:hypothetical protein
MKKVTKTQQIRNYMQEHPTATTDQIAKACKVTKQYVYQVRADEKKRKAKKKVTISASEAKVANMLDLSIEEYAKRKAFLSKKKNFVPVGFTGKTLKELEKNANPAFDARIPQFDNVNHPSHYKAGGIETIDFIEAKDLGYHLGNVIKYITRAKHKGNEVEDLKKAQWYLNRAISKLTGDKA